MTPFEQTFEIEAADIDFMGHVSNLVYLRWVQEIAIAHWEAQAPAEAKDTVLWVVLRHEIDYGSAALLGDHVRAKTWVGALDGLKFERHTEMWRQSDGQLLTRTRTIWLPIDSQTRRPKRLSRELRALFSNQEAE